jgi:hypothetical protein
VDNGDVGDAAAQGTLGGPCFPNNMCNGSLVCGLVNGKGVCQEGDASVQDAPADTTTSDAPADVKTDASDAGADGPTCDAGLALSVPCNPGCGGQLCCAQTANCQSGTASQCQSACNGQGCWQCAQKCSGLFCCALNGSTQSSCPLILSASEGTQCMASCTTGLYICSSNNDCPTSNPTCVLASVTGVANVVVGVCQ